MDGIGRLLIIFPIIYVFQGNFIPAGPIAANFLDGTYSKHGAGWNKAMLINSICNILLHLSYFKIAFVGLFLSSKLSKNGRSPWHVSTSVNQTSCYGMSDLRFGHGLVSIKLAILATTSWFTGSWDEHGTSQKRHRTGIDSPQLVDFQMDMGVETYL